MIREQRNFPKVLQKAQRSHGAGNTCSFGNKDYWLGNSVINHISAGIVCVGDYEAAGDVVNGKAAYIRPTSMSFVYKAAPYEDEEYLI